MPEPIYIVYPGYVVSRNDGDRHYVSFERLVQLYGVDPKLCIRASHGPANPKLIPLQPRYDGQYVVPKPATPALCANGPTRLFPDVAQCQSPGTVWVFEGLYCPGCAQRLTELHHSLNQSLPQ